MDSQFTSNTNTSNINNFLFNTTLTEYQINKLQSFQKSQQTFSNILEAYISLAKELYFTQTVFNFVLALLAFAGNRPTFPASHKNLYQLIMDCKNPESAKETNIDTIRKSVWRDLKEVTQWMTKSGITLFTRTIPKFKKNQTQQDATIYNISFLLYTLLEIIQEAHKTIHLHENNLGLAIQAAAKLKAQELRQAATPQPLIEKSKKLNAKQKTTSQNLDYHLLEAKKYFLKLKIELAQSKSLSNDQIADHIEQALADFNNFSSNSILHLRGYQQPKEENPNFCPTSLQHVLLDETLSTTSVEPSQFVEEFLESQEFLEVRELEIGIGLSEADYYGRTNLECRENDLGSDLELEESISQEKDPNFFVTLFNNQYEGVGKEVELTLEEFADSIAMNNPSVITPKSTSKADLLLAKQTNKGFCPAIFVSDEGGRVNDNVDCLTMVCFDFDNGDLTIDLPNIIKLNLCGFIYTSYCHREENHRFRVGFLLDKPISSIYYPLLWNKLFGILKREVGREETKVILNIDKSGSNTSRLWYFPAKQKRDSLYSCGLFTKKDGFSLLNWRNFIAEEVFKFDLGVCESISLGEYEAQYTLVEPPKPGKDKKNVSQSFFRLGQNDCLDKPMIEGWRWPSMFKCLKDKNSDRSLADFNWCFLCACFEIPIELCIEALPQVSSKARERFGRVYGSGYQYHIKTAEESYDFYKKKLKKTEA